MRLPRLHLFAALLLAAPTAGAAAAPLEPAACKALKSEHDRLLAAGLKADMEKGAAWAAKNLPAERLERIGRLITVEEKLSFRCGQLVTARPAMKDPLNPLGEERPKAGKRKANRSTIPLPIRKSEHAAGKAAGKATKRN